ncbi:MAG: hypothetical protein GX291_06755 [Tissierellia bacterium]|jgi:uncharacterized protein YaaQ|nr:cyclic-di-AMP receptor [Bacillota bacterium]NLK58952.1 hypothetical protein [Tissierellia bacterium]
MKMLIAIVQDQDSHILMDELSERDFRMTKLASTGGFLKAGNTTILMGIDEARIPEALSIIENNCKSRDMTTSLMSVTMPGDAYIPYPVELKVGGATVFILDVESFVRI